MKRRLNVTKSRGGNMFLPMIKYQCLPMAITGSLPMTLKESVEVAD